MTRKNNKHGASNLRLARPLGRQKPRGHEHAKSRLKRLPTPARRGASDPRRATILQLFSQAKVHLTTEDSDLSGMRGWQAADAIIAHAIDVLCHRAGLQS